MNTYEAKQAARKARYESRAAQAMQQSQTTHDRAHEMAQAIPMGQPILVGHHSEGRDRRYRGRIQQGYEKAFDLQKQAEHYEQKAQAVGKGGISSDDPQAIEKLSAKLASLQTIQDTMKGINAVLRRHAKAGAEAQITALVEAGLTYPERARELVTPDYAGRIGFAPYQLQNNNANIAGLPSASRIWSVPPSSPRSSAAAAATPTGKIRRKTAPCSFSTPSLRRPPATC